MPYRQFNHNNNNNNNNNRYNNNRNPNQSEATHNQQWNQCNGTSKDHSFDRFRDKDHVDAHSMPLSGQKRPFPISDRADHTDNGGLIKLFIANVPRRAIEDDIRPLFEKHGNVVEIFLIRDKTNGQRRGCCFVKYSTLEDAERAIKALHSQYTFPGEYDPIQVRYADGELQRLRSLPNERKLYVAELNKQATDNEIAEIFSAYGRVEDVCILRDEMKQSLGRGFVEFVQRDMALAAINALNETYVMTGCDQPLIIRFARPRKPKAGDSRNDAALRGSSFGHRVHTSQRIRPESNDGNPTCVAHTQPNGWKKMSPQNSGPSSQAHDFASHSVAKSGAAPVSMATSSKHLLIEVPSGGELLPLEKPLHPSLQLGPSLKLHAQGTPCTSQMQTSLPPMQQLDQLQVPTPVGPFSQALPSEHFNGNRGHSGQFHSQQSTFATAAQQISLNVQTEDEPSTASQKQLCGSAIQQEMHKPLQKSSNQLAEMLTPQLSQTTTQEPRSDDAKLQSSFTGNMQQAAASPVTVPAILATSTITSVPHILTAPPTCEWSEHTCPDGFKYYYNCITKESRWENPKEQQLSLSVQRAHIQSMVQNLLISANSACQMHLTTTSSSSRGRYNGSGQSADFSSQGRGFYRGSSSGSNGGSYGNRGCSRRDQRGDWNREKQNGNTQSYGWSKSEDDQVDGWGNQGSGNNRTSDGGWDKGKPHGDDQSSGWSKDANANEGDQRSDWNREKQNGDTQSYGWSKGEDDQVDGWGNQGSGNNRTSDGGWGKGKPHGDDQSSGWSKDANANEGDQRSDWNREKQNGDTQSLGWSKGEDGQVDGWGNQGSGNNRTSDSGWNKGKPHGDDQSSGWSKDANANAGDQVGGWGSQVSGNKDKFNSDWNREKPHADNESFGWKTQISGETGISNSKGWAGKQIEIWNQSNVAGKTVSAGWNKTIGAEGETNKNEAQADDSWGKAIRNSLGDENSGSGGKETGDILKIGLKAF